jgi:hypothetical protein
MKLLSWLVENAVVCLWAGLAIVIGVVAFEVGQYWLAGIAAGFVVYFGLVQKFLFKRPD